MSTSRRLFLAGGLAVAAAPAIAQPRYAEAAAYSAARNGVSVLVMQGARIVFEDYPAPGGPDRGWELASGTKSFSGVLAAAMVQDGLLRLDERCAETLSEWRGQGPKAEITIRQLLTLSSGLSPGAIGRPPAYADAIQAEVGPPGRFAYGPGPFQAFGEIVRRKVQGDVYDFLTRRLLAPLGIRPTAWRRGADGNPHMPSGAHLTAGDWAKFGRFVLDGGRLDGKALVDPAALAANFESSKANPGYGLTWWLIRPGLIGPTARSGIPADVSTVGYDEDVRMAAGLGNQRLYLLPKRDMLVVRQARIRLREVRKDDWSDAAFLRAILGA